MGAISPLHLIIVLVIAVLVLGPGKLPEVGAALGSAMKQMRDAMDGKEPADPTAAPPGVASATQQDPAVVAASTVSAASMPASAPLPAAGDPAAAPQDPAPSPDVWSVPR